MPTKMSPSWRFTWQTNLLSGRFTNLDRPGEGSDLAQRRGKRCVAQFVHVRGIYKDGNDWKSTSSFGCDDLSLLAKLADMLCPDEARNVPLRGRWPRLPFLVPKYKRVNCA